MAAMKKVTKDFLHFKKGETKSFSTEICKKYSDCLTDIKQLKSPKKEEK